MNGQFTKRNVVAVLGALLVAVFVVTPAAISRGQSPPSVITKVDRNEVQIADPFKLTVSLSAPKGAEVTFPPVVDEMGPFAVISHRDIFDVPAASGRTWTRSYELEAYESGDLQVPAITLIVDQRNTTSQPIDVVVQSLLEQTSDPTQFRELKGVEELTSEGGSTSPWMIGLGLTLLSAIALIVAWLILLRQRSKSTPEQWAYARLADLQNSNAYSTKDATVILPQAANILREYLRRRFHIAAPQQTTKEFLKGIQHDPCLEPDQRQELQEFLRHVDRIKFANLAPLEQLSETVDLVRKFVERSGRATPTDALKEAKPAEAV